MKQRCAMVPARMLSGDHFFKILKCNFKFNGRPLFMAAYSLVNEHTEVMATVLTQTKTLEELRHVHASVQQRMIALGLPWMQIDVFFTDNPTAEAPFLESVYPGWRKTSVNMEPNGVGSPALVPFSLPAPADHSVHYIFRTEAANAAIDNMYRSVTRSGAERVLGLDAEWNCDGGPSGRGPGTVRVVQMSSRTETLVLHVSRMRSFPHQLRALLADPTVVKAGKSIGGDRKKLLTDFGVDVTSTIELGNFAKARQLVGSAKIGLAGLVTVLLKRVLDEDPAVRLSDWSRELTADQQTYAAMDSYASLLVYQYIFSAESPVPLMTSTLIGKQLYLADASGTRRVARCVVADAQPAKYGKFVVGAKERVWVKVVEVLVPAFALPYWPKRGPRSLAELMRESAQLGKDPLMVASRLHLRDADHAVERRLAAERAQVMHPVTAVSGGVAGCFDAMEGLRASMATMCEKGVVPGVAVGDKDAETDDEESPDGSALPVGGAFSGSGDAGGEEAVEGDGEDLSDAEAAADGGAATRGLRSGVKADILHVLDRVLRHAPKNHGATAHFSRCFVHALMFYNDGDAQLAERVAAEKWPEMTWLEVLYRKATWVNRRVRRAVPAAVVIVPRLEAVFKDFANILDASTGQRLFNSAAKSAARKVIKMAKAGWLTDPTVAPLYTLRTHDQDGLPLWLCSRGTNSNERSVHQKLVKNFMSMRRASAELIHYALVEWVHRHNLRAARNNGTSGAYIGHADTWILDDILLLQEHVFGKRVSHLSHERVAEYTLPEFYCGVSPLAPDVLDECGLPGKEMWKQIEPLFERMSKQKRYLAAAMGSGVPILPVHTKEEKLLYLELKERLRRQLLGTPTALAMANEFNKAAADDWLRHATKAAAQKHKRKGRVQMPMIHLKTVGHMTTYQAFYDRNQNIASTILLSHPNTSKPRIAGANVGRMGFGAAASRHKPVSARVPRRSSSGKSVSTGASSRSHAGQSLAPINGDGSTGIVAGALCDVGGARQGGAGVGWEETAGAEAVREMDDAAAVGGGGETVGAAEVETSGEAVDAAAAGVGKGPLQGSCCLTGLHAGCRRCGTGADTASGLLPGCGQGAQPLRRLTTASALRGRGGNGGSITSKEAPAALCCVRQPSVQGQRQPLFVPILQVARQQPAARAASTLGWTVGGEQRLTLYPCAS